MESTQTFTAKDVMTLRQKTGLGMMDCKKALTETNGDMTAAEEWLREQRKGKMDTRTERTTGEGRIGIAVEGAAAVMVEIRTETDFTARNEEFVKMVDDITAAAMGQPAGDVQVTDDITKRIDDLRITTGENVNFARGVKIEGGTLGSYLHHDGKRGVLIQAEGEVGGDLLKGLCQHIVAYDPHSIAEDDVSSEKLQQIREEAIAAAKEAGKPEQIAEKIAEGKIRKFLEEETLLHQKYVLDEEKKVKDLLPSGTTIKRFVRYTLGQ